MNVGFIAILAGGTAAGARPTLNTLVSGQRIPYRAFSLDLDDRTAPDVELPINPLVEPALHAPSKYGPAALWFAAKPERARTLHTVGRGHGAATLRRITQLAFEGYRDRIETGLKDVIDDVCAQGADTIQVLLASSSGGGTGSAITCLVAELLQDRVTRARLQRGHNQDVFAEAPIVFALDPWARVENARHKDNADAFQAKKIEANMYQFRLDIARLSLEGAIRYACFVGRGVKGVDLGNADDAERYLGLLIGQYILGYSSFQAALVNVAEVLDRKGFIDKGRAA